MNENNSTDNDAGDRELRPGYYLVTGSTAVQNSEITLLGLWDIFWSQRALIAAIGTFFAVVSIVVALMLTPVYRAESVLAPVDTDDIPDIASRLGGIASLAGIKVGDSSGGTNAIPIMRSREFASQFIADKNLMPIFFEDSWDATAGKWIPKAAENIPQMFDAVEYFHEQVFSVKEDAMSGIVTIAVEWKNPQLAAQWANDLVNRINSETRARALKEAEKNLSYLQAQLENSVVVETRSAISRLIESELKKIMLANAREQYAFRVIDPAMIPTKKSRPRRALIVIMTTILGGFLALGVALIRHALWQQQSSRDRNINRAT